MNEDILSRGRSGFTLVGLYSTGEAKWLLNRLGDGGINFMIECDTEAPLESDDGSYVETPRVAVFVEDGKIAAATEIISRRMGADERGQA